MAKQQIDSDAILTGMRKRYAAPEWALFFNVANGTGDACRRYCDALAMCLFPSRGLEIHGFEFKVSKTDYRREAADPNKAETIAAYCDRWWVVTPPGLLDGELIAPNWGWLTYDGRAFYTKQKAEKTEAKTIDRPFLAALLRRAHESNEAVLSVQVAEKLADTEAEIQRRVESELKWRTTQLDTLKGQVADFEKAAGVRISTWDSGDVGRAVAIIKSTGVTNIYNGTAHLAKSLRSAADSIDRAMSEAGLKLLNQAAE